MPALPKPSKPSKPKLAPMVKAKRAGQKHFTFVEAGVRQLRGLIVNFNQAPFSVLDPKSGDWQSRKRAWIALGIQSELGRGGELLKFSDQALRHDPGNAMKAAAERTASFKNQGKLNAFQAGKNAERRSAIPGGGTGKNSGWKFKTVDGYQSVKDIEKAERRITPGRGRLGTGNGSALATQQGKTNDLRGGLTYRMTPGAYDDNTEVGVAASGTSIFDPVLCEVFYQWYTPLGGSVLDPFAGGSVRGIVAERMGRRYFGMELSADQLEANAVQAKTICTTGVPGWISGGMSYPLNMPRWKLGDARTISRAFRRESMDAIFSCPPYFDLEQYSDDPCDLSNMSFDDFRDAYWDIIAQAVDCLKPDRFACFVVSNTRDKQGFRRWLVNDTVDAFEAAGAKGYDDAVLVTSIGSLPIRVGQQFKASRKLGRSHQYALIFCKGSPERAAEAINAAMIP